MLIIPATFPTHPPHPTQLPARFGSDNAVGNPKGLRDTLAAYGARRQTPVGPALLTFCAATDADVIAFLQPMMTASMHDQPLAFAGVWRRLVEDAADDIWWSPVHDFIGTRERLWRDTVGGALQHCLQHFRLRVGYWALHTSPDLVYRVLQFAEPPLRAEVALFFANNPLCRYAEWQQVLHQWPMAGHLYTRWHPERIAAMAAQR